VSQEWDFGEARILALFKFAQTSAPRRAWPLTGRTPRWRACGNGGAAGDRPRPVALETPPVRHHGDDCCARVDGLAVAEGADRRSRALVSGAWVRYRHGLLRSACWM